MNANKDHPDKKATHAGPGSLADDIRHVVEKYEQMMREFEARVKAEKEAFIKTHDRKPVTH